MTSPDLLVEIQSALRKDFDTDVVPSDQQIIQWVQYACQQQINQPSEVTIRLVHTSEMQQLNQQYRGKEGSTNVLSFAVDIDDHAFSELLTHQPLGDVVICHDVVASEAEQQGKNILDHYAHMVTHGILHLCGFDHLE